MRGDYAAIHGAILDTPDFKALSPDAKLCWFTLRLLLGASGIDLLRASTTVLEDLTGIDRYDLPEALDELVEGRWLVAQGDVLWLRNALRYNPHCRLNNKNHVPAIEKHIAGLPKAEIVNAFAAYYDLEPPFSEIPSEWDSQWYRDGIPDYDTGHRNTVTRTPDAVAGRRADAREAAAIGDIESLLEGYPDAAAIVLSLNHAGGLASTVTTLRARLLYPDDGTGAMPDPSVQGLPLDERRRLIASALLEYADQGVRDWKMPALTAFVRRLRGREARAPLEHHLGDETARDYQRTEQALARQTTRETEQRDEAAEELDRVNREALDWFEELDPDARRPIEADAEARIKIMAMGFRRVPEAMKTAALLDAIRQAREPESGAAA